ncbi:hypothetical protein JHK82_052384 [Glycine max]|nr:hypothetical protein JHK86_052217 [Glycine max]KAG4926588.1 hypothetical protein JHK85_053074 [Glycine max]KAG5082221.1 hypothetical protein JHK84_052259 [Glycine max]KAG5084987.1 hypothetical protein JHK82_052384 [Glycine max]
MEVDESGESTRSVLQALLPEGMIIPSAFDTVGHIAHLNLRDEHLPYKWLIAKVVLDKNKPRIQTVVNKIDTIQNEYKTMQLEVLAGNHSVVTTVVENGIRFARKKDQMEELRNYSSMEGVLYCKPHFEQLFKESGFFSKKFQSRSVYYAAIGNSISSLFFARSCSECTNIEDDVMSDSGYLVASWHIVKLRASANRYVDLYD